MAIALRTKINLAFGAALLILLAIAAVSYRSTLALLETVAEQSRAQQAITGIESLLANLNAAEGAHRGYLITGDSTHLPRYHAALDAVEVSLARLQQESQFHPDAKEQIRELRRLVDTRVTKFERSRELFHEQGLRAVAANVKGDREDRAIAGQAAALEHTIRGDLGSHADHAARWARLTMSISTLGVVLAALFLIVAGLVIHHETAERASAYAALHEVQLKNAQFLNSLPFGVYVIDADGAGAYANDAARDMLGRDIVPGERNEGPAQIYTMYVAGRKQFYPADRSPLERALRGERSTVEDIEVDHLGMRVPVQVSAAPIYSSEGGITAAIAAFIDISERRQVERIKDELISIVSHELRTPLTSIRGALGLVGSGRLGTLNEQGKRMIDIAIADTDRLVRLINDMLDIERMQSGRIDLHKETRPAAQIVSHAAASVRQIADKAHVRIEEQVDDVSLWCDSDRIVQTLTNLLANAIKFSPAGGKVRVLVKSLGEDIEFRVVDHGRGIPEEKLATIFERFQQVDASDAREKGGAGLGLAIARSIVLQHGGRIWAESDGDNGSTFVFTLPCKKEGQQPAPGGGTVLIVEDDENLAAVLAAQFEAAGLESVFARNGVAAIAKAQQQEPSVIVLDVRLPERNGYEVVDWLRQHERLRDVPVIVYSALDLRDEDRDRLSLGPTEFMTKSRAKPEDVAQRVAEMVRDEQAHSRNR